MDGMISSAIHRRMVRRDIPVIPAISAAGRYSLSALILVAPNAKTGPAGVQLALNFRAIRAPPAEQAGATALSARRTPPDRLVLLPLREQHSWPPGDRMPGGRVEMAQSNLFLPTTPGLMIPYPSPPRMGRILDAQRLSSG